MALNIGATFAGYRIIRLLGSGGMGEVYLAEHPRLPRRDALKILSPDVSTDPDFRRRFHREADLASTLFHPHIVGVHDRGETDGQLWIALDFVDGSDAGDLIRRRYPAGMPPGDAVAVIAAVGAALDYAHGCALLHRDVKPANILLTGFDAPQVDTAPSQRRIMLADFGIARALSDISGLTATNMAVGTVDYAAPEQLTDAALDASADQYSLAATAFHLLTGGPPYRHTSPAVTISRHLAAEVPRAGDIRPELAAFDEPLRTALAKDPADRFPTCRHFVAALAEAAGRDANAAAAPTLGALRTPAVGTPSPAARLAPSPVRCPPPAPAPRRSPLPVIAAAAALGVLAGAVALGVDNRSGPRVSAALSTSVAAPTQPPVTPSPIAPSPVTTTVRVAPSTTTVTETVTPTTETATLPAPPPYTAAPRPFTAPAFRSGAAPGPEFISLAGFESCVRSYTWASCLQAARDAAGAPYSSGLPLTTDGMWMVPQTAGYGDYQAAVGPSGACLWYGYDARGRLVKSGSFQLTGSLATASVTPTMTIFQTRGCTPWFRVAPAN